MGITPVGEIHIWRELAGDDFRALLHIQLYLYCSITEMIASWEPRLSIQTGAPTCFLHVIKP